MDLNEKDVDYKHERYMRKSHVTATHVPTGIEATGEDGSYFRATRKARAALLEALEKREGEGTPDA